jgi:hypothetical protein
MFKTLLITGVAVLTIGTAHAADNPQDGGLTEHPFVSSWSPDTPKVMTAQEAWAKCSEMNHGVVYYIIDRTKLIDGHWYCQVSPFAAPLTPLD